MDNVINKLSRDSIDYNYSLDFKGLKIKDKADECNSMFILTTPFVEPKFADALSLRGSHQIENLALAINAIQHCFKNINEEIIVSGLKKVYHPCRFQFINKFNLRAY